MSIFSCIATKLSFAYDFMNFGRTCVSSVYQILSAHKQNSSTD